MTPVATEPASAARAWLALVGLSARRLARVRSMVGVAVVLLALAVALVAARTHFGGWSAGNNRAPATPVRPGEKAKFAPRPRWRQVYEVAHGAAAVTPAVPVAAAVLGSTQAAFDQVSSVQTFTRGFVLPVFVSFLLPVWCLSFATEAIGGEREGRTMVWLLSRPIPRWAIYLGQYAAALPWCLGLGVGGFALLALAAGEPGRTAFRLFWPAVTMAACAFAALFHLFAALFRRPTVVGLVYAFFFEVLIADLPGMMKRISISFYTRCLIFAAGDEYAAAPVKAAVYLPVDAPTAWAVMLAMTIGLLAVGAWWFERAESVGGD